MRKALTAIAVLAALAGCGGDDDGNLSVERLPALVVQPADLPNDFVRFENGRVRRGDMPGRKDVEPRRFGRQGGWRVRYSRPASGAPGPDVVESRADVFKTPAGAADDLRAYYDELQRPAVGQPTPTLLTAPKIGDDAIAFVFRRSGRDPVLSFTVAWRSRNVSASVTVDGLQGKVDLTAATRLARAQQDRIAEAEA